MRRPVEPMNGFIVRHRTWIRATLAAFFGLHAPLCAVACVAMADAAPTAAHRSEPSCHEEPASAPTEAPAEASGSCCDFADQATAPTADGSLAASAVGLVARTPIWQASIAGGPFARVAAENDLPPPDILLLKSTLIV